MIAFPDTSFLYGLYLNQSHSAAANAIAATLPVPIRLSELLRYEFRQSLRLQLWRRAGNARHGIGLAEYQLAKSSFECDLGNGVLAIASCSLTEVLESAEDLSSRYTASRGHRSFDILHVATAVVLGAREFLTFDLNQQKLAREVGLTV